MGTELKDSGNVIKLNLGCGFRKLDDYINIDMLEDRDPDLCLDVEQGLPFDDNSVDEVRAFDFLEHIYPDKVIYVMNEIWRVLRHGGKFNALVPSTDGRGAFQDPTHRSFWNYNSWLYYLNDNCRALYDIEARYSGKVKDIVTDAKHNIIHTKVELRAIKEIE